MEQIGNSESAEAGPSHPSDSQGVYWASVIDPSGEISTQIPTSSIPFEPGSSRTSSTDSNVSEIYPEGSKKRKARDPLEAPQKKKSCIAAPLNQVFPIHDVVSLPASEEYFRGLPWGFLWEVARLQQTAKWEFIETEIVDVSWLTGLAKRRASCQEAVAELRTRARGNIHLPLEERKKKEPWGELGDEAAAREAGVAVDRACLPERTYGRVYFNAQICENDDTTFKIALGQPEIGQPYRFSRVYGSEAIIRLNARPKSFDQKKKNPQKGSEVIKFLSGKSFKIFHKTFQAFAVKDDTVLLIDTASCISLFDAINWHNPTYLNAHQPTAKWAARFHLGFSTTESALLIPRENVFFLDDFDGTSRRLKPGKLPTNQTMTDGCGYANDAVLKLLQKTFQWKYFPSAIQFRYGGAKGMLLRRPAEDDPSPTTPQIWLRPSQIKIKYDVSTPSQQILEVVAPTQLTTPFRLAPETLANLHHNKVPSSVFRKLSKDGMQEIYDAFTNWEGAYGIPRLYKHISDAGGVLGMRLERINTEATRARGYFSIDRKEEGFYGSEEDQNQSEAWFPDPVSECPSTLEETVLEMLRYGFDPQSCYILAVKLGEVIKKNLNPAVKDLRLRVPMSAYVHCAPVPERFKHLLKPNQVHLLSSAENLAQIDGGLGRTIGKQALISRYPCKVPSDFQKVEVVECHELSPYTDVMLMPIEADRSLASMLGGGDYDGDRVVVIWDPQIVNPFKQPHSRYADPPADFDSKNFEPNNTTVSDVLQPHLDHVDGLTTQEKQKLARDLQRVLLSSLNTSNLISVYSIRHDKAVARLGYGHPETVRLAYMFCTVLDGSKSGKRVLDQVLRKDARAWDGFEMPEWKKKLDGNPGEDNPRVLRKPRLDRKPLKPLLLDSMKSTAETRRDALMNEYDEKFMSIASKMVDLDLRRPWDAEKQRLKEMADTRPEIARMFEEEILEIERHVKKELEKSKAKAPESTTKGPDFTKKPIRKRQDMLRAESRSFVDGPTPILYDSDRLCVLRASYAYIEDIEAAEGKPPTRWPWNVAMGELGRIKAKSGGGQQRAALLQNLMQVGGLRRLPL